MGPWLPADFNLIAFEIFAAVAGSAEWLTVEHPVPTLLVLGVLIGWQIRKRVLS
jgi:hypothetical protein